MLYQIENKYTFDNNLSMTITFQIRASKNYKSILYDKIYL